MINIHDKGITETMPLVGAKAFCVLLAIVKHMNVNRAAFPSRFRLQKLTGLGRDAVDVAINRLCKEGVLSKKQRHINGKLSSNTYKVKSSYFGKFVSAEDFGYFNQVTENQVTENPTVSIDRYEVLNTNEVLNYKRSAPPPKSSMLNTIEVQSKIKDELGYKCATMFIETCYQTEEHLPEQKSRQFYIYLRYRASMKKYVNDRTAFNRILREFQSHPLAIIKAAIDYSMKGGYPGLYWDRDYSGYTTEKNENRQGSHTSETEEEAKERRAWIDAQRKREYEEIRRLNFQKSEA